MKKILLICALGLFAVAAGAQEVAKKPSFKGFVTNGFWDNWELSVGGGVNYVAWDGLGFSGQPDRSDNIGWALEGTATKWFTPVIGMRAQLIGGRLYMSDGKSGKYDCSYILPHVDGIANLSNWIGGYREDRVFYVKAFAGFGANFTAVRSDNVGEGFVFDAGLLGSFRVCKALDINIEGKFFLSPSKDMPYPVSQVGGKIDQIYSLTVGATYRFNKRDWQRGVPGYTADDIKAFQDAVAAGAAATAAANAANTKLSKQLKDTEAALASARNDAALAAKEAADAKRAAAEAANNSVKQLLLYDLGSSNLTARERTRLDLMADMIKNGPKDRVYHLEGHADYQTGTKAGNQRLSENRAKKAYNYLVSKGVNPDQLTYKGFGGEDNPYPVQKANRAVVIK